MTKEIKTKPHKGDKGERQRFSDSCALPCASVTPGVKPYRCPFYTSKPRPGGGVIELCSREEECAS